jgi:hypothetical protein
MSPQNVPGSGIIRIKTKKSPISEGNFKENWGGNEFMQGFLMLCV